MKKNEIKDILSLLIRFPNIICSNKLIIIKALFVFEKYNLDFADSLLVAYFKMDKSEIITFDKKLNSILAKIEF